jgi:hypothetical protein
MTISEQTASNSQSLTFLPIQMTSIEEEVTRKPNQTSKPQTIPVEIPAPAERGEVETNK